MTDKIILRAIVTIIIVYLRESKIRILISDLLDSLCHVRKQKLSNTTCTYWLWIVYSSNHKKEKKRNAGYQTQYLFSGSQNVKAMIENSYNVQHVCTYYMQPKPLIEQLIILLKKKMLFWPLFFGKSIQNTLILSAIVAPFTSNQPVFALLQTG